MPKNKRTSKVKRRTKPKVTHYGNQPVHGPKRVGVASRLAKNPYDLDAPRGARETARMVKEFSGAQISDRQIREMTRQWR